MLSIIKKLISDNKLSEEEMEILETIKESDND